MAGTLARSWEWNGAVTGRYLVENCFLRCEKGMRAWLSLPALSSRSVT